MIDDPEPEDKETNEWCDWRVRQMQAAAAARDEVLIEEMSRLMEPAIPAIDRAFSIGLNIGEREPSQAESAALSANLHAIVHAVVGSVPGAHLKAVPDDSEPSE